MSDFKTVVFCACLALGYWLIFVAPHSGVIVIALGQH